MRLSVIGTLFSAVSALALGGCNSTTALESMESIPRSTMTTSSIEPAEPLDVNAYAAPLPETKINTPVAEKEVGVQTASLRADIVTPTKSPAVTKSKSGSKHRPKVYQANFSDKKPIDFGKAAPEHFDVHGVDVSRWQYDIDWAQLRKRGGNFAFIKATEGGDHLDPMFKTNW
ncbi:MAG: GH25 family lysozyme, partial [Salaquimonas sp.]